MDWFGIRPKMHVIIATTFLNVSNASKALIADIHMIAICTFNVSMDIMFPIIVTGIYIGMRL